METLNLTPRGDVQVDRDFGTRSVSFENGVKQYQRIWVTPRVTYSFTAQGDKTMKTYLENFITARQGNYEPFYWNYEGERLIVRFADSKLSIKEIRGYAGEGTVGYEASIALEKLKDSEITA
jgi:phage-related protein